MNQATIQPVPKARHQGKKHADASTPLVRNCWYIAAFSEEVSHELRDRWLLGQNVLLYRTTGGEAVAVQNRCPHRGFPLSKGYREGDTVVCGYHGLTFDPSGACVRAPMLRAAPPSNVRIQKYPVVERKPLVWIWMGDPARADESQIPEHSWLSEPNWASVGAYYHVGANYVGLHENLLDLTHFSYLHAGNVGTPEYVSSPFEVSTEGNKVRIVRRLENAPAPQIYAVPMNLGSKRVIRVSDSWFISPAFHVAFASITDQEAAPGERAEYKVNIMHMLTPETQSSFHYFFYLSRDFALDDPSAGKWLKDGALQAFNEDREALQWIKDIADREDRAFTEVSFGSDRAGLQMRRVIQILADAETNCEI